MLLIAESLVLVALEQLTHTDTKLNIFRKMG